MTSAEIISKLAAEGRVEGIVLRIAHASFLTTDLKDLVQMVYLALLEYDGERLAAIWSSGRMDFFLARIVMSNLRSRTSRYHYVIRRFRSMSAGLDEAERVGGA